MKTILITGGAGFIGSNFIPYFLDVYSDYKIINLDKLTYAGELDNLKEISSNPRYDFIKGDICDKELVERIFKDNNIQGVIHFAAESHVDNSIVGPAEFIRTNIFGTFTLLEVARNHWYNNNFKIKDEYKSARFLHVSTDEVYGTLGEIGFFTESTSYSPTSPYSASKASSDLIARSFFHTYKMNIVITNCSNNYGPKQHKEKLIPTLIINALKERPLPIYGDGKNIRDWLYVTDHCIGIDLAFHTGTAGESYNIGGRNEKTNLQIVDKVTSILDIKQPRKNGLSYKELITFVADRPGHDKRYAIDATKIETELKWKAKENFDTGIIKTIEWYLERY